MRITVKCGKDMALSYIPKQWNIKSNEILALFSNGKWKGFTGSANGHIVHTVVVL